MCGHRNLEKFVKIWGIPPSLSTTPPPRPSVAWGVEFHVSRLSSRLTCQARRSPLFRMTMSITVFLLKPMLPQWRPSYPPPRGRSPSAGLFGPAPSHTRPREASTGPHLLEVGSASRTLTSSARKVLSAPLGLTFLSAPRPPSPALHALTLTFRWAFFTEREFCVSA